MTREKALEALDRLNELGYTVSLMVRPAPGPHDHGNFREDPADGRTYYISVIEMRLDKVDVRKLVEVADELELDCGFSPANGSSFSLNDPDAKPEVLRQPRRHPR